MVKIKGGPLGHEIRVTVEDEEGGKVDIPCYSIEIRLSPDDIAKAMLIVPVGEIDLELLPEGVMVIVEGEDGS